MGERVKTDEQLRSELAQATAGLLFMSEADYPFQVIGWESPAEINLPYLRDLAGRDANAAVAVGSIEDFFRAAVSEPAWKGERELAEARRYQALVRLLRENLDDLKVYRVGTIDIIVFIVGRSKTGAWVGLSTRVIET